MSRYSSITQASNLVTTTAAWEIKAPNTAKPALMELSFNMFLAGSGMIWGLGKAATSGTAIGAVAVQSEVNATEQGMTKCAVVWSVAPTVPVQFFRRVSPPAAVGGGIIWNFIRGLEMSPGTSLVLWNLTSNVSAGYLTVNATVDE